MFDNLRQQSLDNAEEAPTAEHAERPPQRQTLSGAYAARSALCWR